MAIGVCLCIYIYSHKYICVCMCIMIVLHIIYSHLAGYFIVLWRSPARQNSAFRLSPRCFGKYLRKTFTCPWTCLAISHPTASVRSSPARPVCYPRAPGLTSSSFHIEWLKIQTKLQIRTPDLPILERNKLSPKPY